MTEETGGTLNVVALPAGSEDTFETAGDAFKALQKQSPPAESAENATADPELSEEGNAESPEKETTSEDKEAEPETPAIDPPKSWTKDLHERWKGLDPETQKTIVERDRQDQAAIKRAFNEAADDRKAAQAERSQAEQARKQYEAQLPALMQTLTDAQQSAFSDIRTVDDVTKLASEDPFRYLQWQAHQTKLQAVKAEIDRAEGQKAQEHQTDWSKHVQKENELAADLIPELADKTKGPALMKRAVERLTDLGFKSDELNELASGKQKLSVHDHRIQRLVADSLELASIKSAKTAVTQKPVPQVQRPGAARAPGAGNAETVKALETKLNNSGSEKDAWALYQARQSSRRAS